MNVRTMSVEELADKATEAFFTELFRHVPADTSGDLDPLTTAAFEKAARIVVTQIAENIE